MQPDHDVDDSDAGARATDPQPSLETLFPQLYRELRSLARSRLAHGNRPTLLDTSALVHEAFMRMQRQSGTVIADREHLLAYAATTMRSIVVDVVRRRLAERRGGDLQRVTMPTDIGEPADAADDEILAVHDALDALRAVDPKLVQVVEMRYFAGLDEAEVAAAMGVTDRTVRRYWERARLMLRDLLRPG